MMNPHQVCLISAVNLYLLLYGGLVLAIHL